MRLTMILCLCLLLGGVGSGRAVSAARAPRTVACCLTIDIPGVTPGPVCQRVNLRLRPRRLSAKRFCRLIGGTLPVNGVCTCPD